MSIKFWENLAKNWSKVIDLDARKKIRDEACLHADSIIGVERKYSANPIDDFEEDDYE